VTTETAGACGEVRVSDNPARERISIHATIPAGRLGIEVFDVAGRRVATLVREAPVDGGTYAVRWDGLDAAGRPVPSGVYTVAVRSACGESTAKLTWIR
jgi:flagellar basal-body rod modification protein FlgD